MHVIGAGLPRTGTLTQKLAIEQLGLGPCYHWVDVLADLDRVAQWRGALDGQHPWEKIFAGYASTVDWPGGFFYRELSDAYPAAKVVLSVRDPARWEESFRGTIWNMCFGEDLIHHLSAARATIDPQWRRYLDLVDRMLWSGKGTFAQGHEEPQQLIDAMARHNDAVVRAIAPERLLVWDVREGWEPLCAFLGVPVPNEALPHANDRDAFLDRVASAALSTIVAWRERQSVTA